jgi:ubiquinone/menaquinone biosynthesis C-methylase UbiE
MGAAHTNASVQRQFGAVANAYANSAVHSTGPDLAALVQEAALTGIERVLDMGCGAGHTALALAPKASSVVAVDVTAEMVAVATRLAAERGITNLEVRQADVSSLPFGDAEFDLVTSRLSAHHYADPQKALQEAARVLKPGGKFLLIDTVAPEEPALDTFYQAWEFLRDPSHVRNWRATEWLRMAAAAGFKAEVIGRWAIPIDGADWVKRMQTPDSKAAMIRELFAEANPAQRAAFELRDEPWGMTQPFFLMRGLRTGD